MEEAKKKKNFKINDDKEIVEELRSGLKMTKGYCPCKRYHVPENKCMCKEFRDALNDDNVPIGTFCYCMLYQKIAVQ